MEREFGALEDVYKAIVVTLTLLTGSVAPVAASAKSVSSSPHLLRVPGVVSPNATTAPLVYHGGPVQNTPMVYLVFWGWTSDPSGEKPYLINFLSSIGGSPWLNTVTQYGGGNPPNLLQASWSDPSPIPAQPSNQQIQDEVLAAYAHFGLDGISTNVQVVIATPTGHSPSGFGSSYCSYHGDNQGSPLVIFIVFPYNTDVNTCGANFVGGVLDGVSIVIGHELAETITDPVGYSGWDSTYGEIGDECAWTNLADVTTANGRFAVQPLWSNIANGCVLSTTTSEPTDAPVPTWALIALAGALICIAGRARCNSTHSYSILRYEFAGQMDTLCPYPTHTMQSELGGAATGSRRSAWRGR